MAQLPITDYQKKKTGIEIRPNFVYLIKININRL